MNVFLFTRLKLTIWYVTAIMTVSVMFSMVIYTGVTQNLEQSFIRAENRLRGISGIEMSQQLLLQATSEAELFSILPNIENKHELHQFFLDELKNSKQKVLYHLLFANGLILLASTLASYLLASKTLRPVEDIMLEQKRFIADASHELRTPLTSLKTTIEVSLRDKSLDKKAKKILESNLEDVDSLTELIESLLQLASQEKRTITKQLIDIHEVASRVIKTVKPLAKEKNIIIVSKLAHQQILASETALVQLLTILLDNAIKYSRNKGTVRVDIVSSKRSLVITVSDAGIGIHKKYLPHIFDRFYRVDSSRTSSQHSGFGLGLSVAKQIVLNHKGSICVASTIGKGTIFTISLPL